MAPAHVGRHALDAAHVAVGAQRADHVPAIRKNRRGQRQPSRVREAGQQRRRRQARRGDREAGPDDPVGVDVARQGAADDRE